MRKSLIVVLSLLMVVVFAVSAGAAEGLEDGHYVAYEENSHGDLVIEYIVERGQLVDVNMLNPFKLNYSYDQGRMAFFEYPYKVLTAENPTKLDVVSGATHSYESYNAAAEMALSIADGSYTGNKYYGVAENFAHGHVLVEITVEGEKITDARLITANPELDDREKLMPAKGADYPSEPAKEFFNTFADKVVENQGNVDLITGATHSYDSYNEALDMAMTQAGLK